MRNLVLPLTLALLAPAAAAQCFDDAYGKPLGDPTALFGDVMFAMEPIGFPFPLGGATYADIHVCDKGYVFLSNAGVPANTGVDITPTAAELASEAPRICALWSDIQVLTSNNGQVYIKSTPQVCTITWVNAQCYQATSGIFNMQMQLKPSGEVKLLYGPGTTNNSDPTQPTWQVGVAGLSPGMGVPLPATSDLSAGGVTTDNTLVEQWLVANTFDMANTGLLIIPTSPTGYTYVPLGSPGANCASTNIFGTGCGIEHDSVYEEWTSGFDLNNTTVTWLRSGSGYVFLTGISGTIVPPTAAAINIAPGMLDAAQLVTLSSPMPVPGGVTTSLAITTKGQIEVTSVLPFVDYTPTPAELLAAPNTTFALWHDWDQTDPGSGLILYEEIGGVAYATWNGVHSFSASTPSTFQFQIDIATGNITLVIGTLTGFAAPDSGVLGSSAAGPSPDPGPTDFSAFAGSITLADNGTFGAQLTTTSPPAIGNSAFGYFVYDAPVSVLPAAIQFFGTGSINPGLDLTFLGMPGCFAYTNANLVSITFPLSPNGTGVVNLPLPSNPALVGVVLSSQTVCFSTATPFGLTTSNAVEITVGN